ncbi:hypothetical protein ACFQ15_14950 [Sphingomonas hankookensis]|uniref:hypothetical protein n=1 Tax=Sphingomonas hankookensis TaxID=563996 RepID=UPI001F575AA3|nr:hypothetical protein [Sphingomonas hankookensis]
MENLLPIAEQLDRAAVELRLDHPIHNRLAIILIDNTVELMVKDALFVHTAISGDYGGITAKHRKMARSRNLHQQLAVLTFAEEFTSLEAEFVLAAHDHRNSAYHEGYAGEPYLRQLAFLYYHFACRYLTRFSKAFYIWSSQFQYTDIGRRYHDASREEDGLLGKIDRAKLAQVLLDQLPEPCAIPLQQALADDLHRDREGVMRSLRFLRDNTWPKHPTAILLAKAQFESARDFALEKQGLENTSWGTARRIEAVQFANKNHANFAPRYKAVPHGSWAQSIVRIRSADDPMLATVLFQRTRKSMAFLRDTLSHAVLKLEGELHRD